MKPNALHACFPPACVGILLTGLVSETVSMQHSNEALVASSQAACKPFHQSHASSSTGKHYLPSDIDEMSPSPSSTTRGLPCKQRQAMSSHLLKQLFLVRTLNVRAFLDVRTMHLVPNHCILTAVASLNMDKLMKGQFSW